MNAEHLKSLGQQALLLRLSKNLGLEYKAIMEDIDIEIATLKAAFPERGWHGNEPEYRALSAQWAEARRKRNAESPRISLVRAQEVSEKSYGEALNKRIMKIVYWPEGYWADSEKLDQRDIAILGDNYTTIDVPEWMNEADIKAFVREKTK